MRLTLKLVIIIAKELWVWMAETGSPNKEDWPGWKKYGKMKNNCKYGQMKNNCPLCEYTLRHGGFCGGYCPYYKKFGHCEGKDSPYLKWSEALSTKTRKRYAQEFLNQLNELEEK